jgi:hypothetical protein
VKHGGKISMKTIMAIGVVAVGMFFTFCMICGGNEAQAKKSARFLRVGIYDSRAVAVAWAASKWDKDEFQSKMKEMEQAKAAGDEAKMKELRAWGEKRQHQLHLQGFGSAPVKDLLKPVQKELAAVAQQVGVDLIVSQWQIDYQASDAELVDITDKIVALYNPNERTLKIVQDLKKHQPMAENKIPENCCSKKKCSD